MWSKAWPSLFRVAIVAGGTAAVLAGLAGSTPAAWAQAVPDQVNDPPATTTFSCGGGALMRQSFTPGLPVVSAVEIRLRAGGSFPAAGLRLRLRLLALDGTERAQAMADVAGPLAAGTGVLAHFDLAAPVAATGERLVIAWESTGPGELSWFGTDGDPYSRGEAFGCGGAPVAGRDYNFLTYGLSPGAVPTAAPTLAAPVCPQIRGRVPDADIAAALADPARVAGHAALERPGLPASPFNRPRTWLSLRSLGVPYMPVVNGLVWRGGCP